MAKTDGYGQRRSTITLEDGTEIESINPLPQDYLDSIGVEARGNLDDLGKQMYDEIVDALDKRGVKELDYIERGLVGTLANMRWMEAQHAKSLQFHVDTTHSMLVPSTTDSMVNHPANNELSKLGPMIEKLSKKLGIDRIRPREPEEEKAKAVLPTTQEFKPQRTSGRQTREI